MITCAFVRKLILAMAPTIAEQVGEGIREALARKAFFCKHQRPPRLCAKCRPNFPDEADEDEESEEE